MCYSLTHTDGGGDCHCDLPSVYTIIRKHLGSGRNPSQVSVIGDIFSHYFSDENYPDRTLDPGNVNRWVLGKLKVSSDIICYYADAVNLAAMASDIEAKILPNMFDPAAAAEELLNLLLNDDASPKLAKEAIAKSFTTQNIHSIAVFLSQIVYFSLKYPLVIKR